MAEEATAVNDAVVTDATTTAPAAEETQSLEVVREGADLNPSDYREEETEDDEVTAAVDETETPQGEEKPLAPKSENRFQKLANENRELKEQIDRLTLQETQLASEQELLNEVNPDTGELYTIQEIERLSFQQSRASQQQSLAQQRYGLQVQQNQQTIQSEAQRALQEFSMFDETSPDYDQEAAIEADQLLSQSLIFDENGTLVGSKLSPYQLYKSIAIPAQRAASKAATVGQAAAQKATEKMLANADGPVSNAPSKPNRATEDAMSPKEYAEAKGLKKIWE